MLSLKTLGITATGTMSILGALYIASVVLNTGHTAIFLGLIALFVGAGALAYVLRTLASLA